MKIFIKLFLFLFVVANTYAEGVKEYYITCNQDDFDYIYQNFEEDNYIPVTFEYNNEVWTDVRMRIRGDDSRKLPKKSLKLKFDSIAFANGRDVLNFNAEYYDKTFMRQYLATRLFKESGHPCFSTEHARLYLNGKYLGLYLNVENMDAEFLSANGLDPKGNLYKATKDGACLSVHDDPYTHWEKKTNAPNDRDDLVELINNLNNIPDSEYYQFAMDNLNYDRMVNILAMNMLLSNGSTYYHNYYMYHDPSSGKWSMLPWDMDKTFTNYSAWFPYDYSSPAWMPDNSYMERAILCPPIFEDIKARVNYLGSTIFNKNHIWPIMDSLKNVLQQSVVEDMTDDGVGIGEFNEAIEKEKAFAEQRFGILKNNMEKAANSFRVFETDAVYDINDDIVFRWNKPNNSTGSDTKYDFYYVKDKLINHESRIVHEDLTDTVFTIPETLETGEYMWKVVAKKNGYSTEGFSSWNKFSIKTVTELPCIIDQNMTLTKENSPYKTVCYVNVLPGVTLTIEPGVEIWFMADHDLIIQGKLICNGSADDNIIFEAKTEHEYCRNSVLYEDALPGNTLNNIKILDINIRATNSDISADNIQMDHNRLFVDYAQPLFRMDSCLVVIRNSDFRSNTSNLEEKKKEGIVAFACEGTIVDNCKLFNLPDAIEYVRVNGGQITNNSISFIQDDAIDLNGSKNAIIANNRIIDVSDKGISLGFDKDEDHLSEGIQIIGNLIVSCAEGIAVKSGSSADIINNTFFDDNVSVALYEKGSELGGGHAKIKNCIFSNSGEADYTMDNESTLEISYSLSDKYGLPGEGNILTDPKFIDPGLYNFNLQMISPCIDAGDPDDDPDPDGSRADIGAYYFDKSIYTVVINEINYNSSDDFNPGDWVEFYNISDEDVDMTDWYFKDDNPDHSFVFPEGTILNADSYLVLCRTSDDFKALFPNVDNYIGDMGFGISGSGEMLRLYNSSGIIIDSVIFMDSSPWPTEPDGSGPTLELNNPALDNTKAKYWSASEGHGTPGGLNSSFSSNKVIEIPGYAGFAAFFAPNPCYDLANISVFSENDETVRITVRDILGAELRVKESMLSIGENIIPLDFNNIRPGMYFVELKSKNKLTLIKIIHI